MNTDYTLGLKTLTELSINQIEASDYNRNIKRGMLAGLYAFAGKLYDGEFLNPSTAMYDYNLCFKLSAQEAGISPDKLTVGEVTDTGAVVLENDNGKFLKIDCGSPVWDALKEGGALTGEAAALPQMPSEYELVYRIVSDADVQLKALWFIYFPYAVITGAKHERDLYDMIKSCLYTGEVFDAVLYSKYSDLIYDDEPEARSSGLDPIVIDFYQPFIEYKLSPDDKGEIRQIAKFKRAIALKEYDYALEGTERLMNVMPHNSELVMLNIAARTQCLEGKSKAERTSILSDTLELIDTVASIFPDRAVYLAYYRGLTLLGLGDAEAAEEQFDLCLTLQPDFELALFMKKAMDKVKTNLNP